MGSDHPSRRRHHPKNPIPRYRWRACIITLPWALPALQPQRKVSRSSFPGATTTLMIGM